MKKIYGILVAAGILLAMISVSAMAYSDTEFVPYAMAQENTYVEQLDEQQLYAADEPPDDGPQKKVGLRGIWGHAGDNESDGYFGARITRRNRVGVFNGLYNTTGNESKTRIVGIMRHGYFNGKIITEDGGKCPVTGLYKINRENQVFKLRWMTPHGTGWAVARIILPE